MEENIDIKINEFHLHEKEVELEIQQKEDDELGYEKGLTNWSGRGKKEWYNGYWCDGSWELTGFVIYNLYPIFT